MARYWNNSYRYSPEINWVVMKKIILIIISSLSGLFVLLGLFFPGAVLGTIKNNLVDWAFIIGSIALVIAIINLLTIHWNRVFNDKKRDYASPFFIVGFVIVLLIGLIFGPSNQFFIDLSKTTIITVESSLLAVLAITLSLASFRFFRQKHNLLAIIFGISTIVFLLLFSGILSLGGSSPFLKFIINGLNNLPIAGGTGILIGIALGAIVTSIRILIGLEKPFDWK